MITTDDKLVVLRNKRFYKLILFVYTISQIVLFFPQTIYLNYHSCISGTLKCVIIILLTKTLDR